MDRAARILVTGHTGMVGAALTARLAAEGYLKVVTVSRARADLTDAAAVRALFEEERPVYVFHTAAMVGGILANQRYPADFIHTNLRIDSAVLDAAAQAGVRRLLFFGCACAYPRDAAQPMREGSLLTGPVEPTSEAFAVAKIAAVKMAEAYNRQRGTAFVAVMPASVYGPGDRFDPDRSHVLAALVRKFHDARRDGGPVVLWGSGAPRREFLYVDDLADACLHLIGLDEAAFGALAQGPSALVNVGVGEDITISELARLIQSVVGFDGDVRFDRSRPDGAARKLLDATRMRALGWAPRTPLAVGVRRTVEWYNHAARCSTIERR